MPFIFEDMLCMHDYFSQRLSLTFLLFPLQPFLVHEKIKRKKQRNSTSFTKVVHLLNLMSLHSSLSPSLYFMLGFSVGIVHSKRLDRWIMLSFHHYSLMHSPCPKNILYTISSFPWSWAPSNLWFSFFSSHCFYSNCHIVWIIQHAAFSGWPLLLSDMHSSFHYVLPWLLSSFPFGIK